MGRQHAKEGDRKPPENKRHNHYLARVATKYVEASRPDAANVGTVRSLGS